jgi:5-methylcytosine-specific restriction enzyme A
MPAPPELKPVQPQRVMDLAKFAGLDVSGWSKYKRGAENAAANPKYCYEWALMQRGGPVVCNLWWDEIDSVRGIVEQRLNVHGENSSSVRKARRARMMEAIGEAYRNKLSVRVIVLDRRTKRSKSRRKTLPGIVRLLDPKRWSVVRFDQRSGEVILRRGTWASKYADQYSSDGRRPPRGKTTSREVTVTVRNRDTGVREYVRNRAKGHCEHCGKRGFYLPNGRMYFETHHIVPLSERGRDWATNVIALCANDHREAHQGTRADELAKAFKAKVRALERST